MIIALVILSVSPKGVPAPFPSLVFYDLVVKMSNLLSSHGKVTTSLPLYLLTWGNTDTTLN